MDIPLAKNPATPPEENEEEPKKSLNELRKQLETGQGMPPSKGDEAVTENKNQPLANPKIQTPNIGSIKPE